MIKKSQFALVFLTVAAMLAVWFIKDPLAASTNKPNEQITETSRLRGIKDLRESLSATRDLAINEYNTVIASSTTTVLEKEAASNSIKQLNEITEKEVLLEVSIINLGYVDCFVHYTTDVVDVLVVKDELTALEVLDIIDVVNNSFESGSYEVIVKYQSAESLK